VNYLLDTNILIIYSRESATANQVESEYQIFNGNHNLALSVVTLGELDSITKQFKYGDKRKKQLSKLVEQLFVIDINIKGAIERYGDIDAFSQGKLLGKPLGDSSRNMGKNDLWIAATASFYSMTLITSDKDFQHLQNHYLKLEFVDLEKYRT